MNPHYPSVAERASHRCEYCHPPHALFNFPFEVEHVIPSSQEGADDDFNLALACRACNLNKSDHLSSRDELTGADVQLFNPRQDRWEEHFVVDEATTEIRGLTSVGRATV